MRTMAGGSVGKADELMHGADTQLCRVRSYGHKPLSAATLGAPQGLAVRLAKPGEPSAAADALSNQINASPDAPARVRCS